MYYYFCTIKGNLKCAVSEEELLAGEFTPMTEEQIARYVGNETADPYHIRDGFPVVEPPIEPDPIPLEEYKAMKVAELDTLSLTTAGELCPTWKLLNSQISKMFFAINDTTEGGIYDLERSNYEINRANNVARACKCESERVYSVIQVATTNEEVDLAFNSNTFEQIKQGYNTIGNE